VTHTYAILDVSSAAYEEIRQKLAEAGYEHAFNDDGDGRECIDMHGVALRSEPSPEATKDVGLPPEWRTVLPQLQRIERQPAGHNGDCPKVDGPDELCPGRPCEFFEVGVRDILPGTVFWWWGASVEDAIRRAAAGIRAPSQGQTLRETEGFQG